MRKEGCPQWGGCPKCIQPKPKKSFGNRCTKCGRFIEGDHCGCGTDHSTKK